MQKPTDELSTQPLDLQLARRVLSTTDRPDSPYNGDVQLPCPNLSVARLLSDRVPVCAAAVNVAHIREWSRISRSSDRDHIRMGLPVAVANSAPVRVRS